MLFIGLSIAKLLLKKFSCKKKSLTQAYCIPLNNRQMSIVLNGLSAWTRSKFDTLDFNGGKMKKTDKKTVHLPNKAMDCLNEWR